MSEVFAYGSLVVPDVMRSVTGKSWRHEPATLSGYRRTLIQGQVYPGIVPAETGNVSGRVYFDVDPAALDKLDYFESEVYDRQTVSVVLGDGQAVDAFAYVVAPPHRGLLSEEPWDEAAFVAEHLPAFLARCQGWMDGYGAQ